MIPPSAPSPVEVDVDRYRPRPRRMPALTRRQREVFDVVEEFIRTRRYSPSLEEIAERLELSSTSTVSKHVANLIEKGLLRRDWNRSRSLELVEQGDPACCGAPALICGNCGSKPGSAS